MKISIELNDNVLSEAISKHLLDTDTVRQSVAKAFNKSEFVTMFSDWLTGEFAASLKTALGQTAVTDAMKAAITSITSTITEEVMPTVRFLNARVIELEGNADKDREKAAATTAVALHPSIAKRIR